MIFNGRTSPIPPTVRTWRWICSFFPFECMDGWIFIDCCVILTGSHYINVIFEKCWGNEWWKFDLKFICYSGDDNEIGNNSMTNAVLYVNFNPIHSIPFSSVRFGSVLNQNTDMKRCFYSDVEKLLGNCWKHNKKMILFDKLGFNWLINFY